MLIWKYALKSGWRCLNSKSLSARWPKKHFSWLSQALDQPRLGWLDLAQNPLFTQAVTETAVTGRFVIPILVDEEIAALLEFFASETADLDENLLNLLERIALYAFTHSANFTATFTKTVMPQRKGSVSAWAASSSIVTS